MATNKKEVIRKKVITILKDLVSELECNLEHNRDKNESTLEVEEAIESLEYAIEVVKLNGKQVGTLTLNGNKYFITK